VRVCPGAPNTPPTLFGHHSTRPQTVIWMLENELARIQTEVAALQHELGVNLGHPAQVSAASHLSDEWRVPSLGQASNL
jgi:hypothetical protein